MITDRQERILMENLGKGKSLVVAASKTDMDEKTARKYRHLGKLPSEHPFSEVWKEIEQKLQINPGLEVKALFEHLQSLPASIPLEYI